MTRAGLPSSSEFRTGPVRRLERFSAVRLRAAQRDGGVVFPAGARGVIVDAYEDKTYGVEFASPAEDVVIVRGEDLEPV